MLIRDPSRLWTSISHGWRPLLLTSGGAARAAAQWSILFAFTVREGPEGAGEFAFALALTAPLIAFLELSLRNVMQSQVQRSDFRVFLILRAVSCVIFVALVAILQLLLFDGTEPVLLAVAFMKVADSFLDIFLARLLSEQRIVLAAATHWLNAAISIILVVLVLFSGWPILITVLTSGAVSAFITAGLALFDRDTNIEKSSRSDLMRNVKGLTAAGVPLSAAQSIVTLVTYAPVLVLTAYGEISAAGIYASLQYFITCVNLYFMGVQQASLSKLRIGLLKNGQSGWRAFQVPVSMMIVPTIGVALILAITIPFITQSIYGPSFVVPFSAASIIAVAILLLALENSALMVLLAWNRYRVHVLAAVMSVLPVAALAITVVPHAGLAGAALMTASAILTRTVVMVTFVGRAARAAH